MKLCPPQRFVGVDIAHAGNKRLVHQERLEAAFTLRQPAPEFGRREGFGQRLRSELVEKLTDVPGAEDSTGLAFPVEAQAPEFTRIAHAQFPPVIAEEPRVYMLIAHFGRRNNR